MKLLKRIRISKHKLTLTGLVSVPLIVAVLLAIQPYYWSMILSLVVLALGAFSWQVYRQMWKTEQYNRAYLEELANRNEARTTRQAVWPSVGKIEKSLEETMRAIEALASSEGLPDFKYLSADYGIGQSLVGAHQQMDQYQKIESRRTWIVEGLAKFAELAHREYNDRREYAYQVLRILIRQIKASQGGIYFTEEDNGEPVLTLMAAYAFDRRKYQEQTIMMGEGLLGQALFEKELIYLNEVPEDYVSISSGLGDAPPRCIIVVPLVLKEVMYGAIEMASFHPLQEHEINFLRQLSENLAATLADLAAKEKNRMLLNESQKLTTELKNQEQEMRESFEQLKNTQEQMHRKQAELDGVVKAVDATLGMAHIDLQGTFLQINQRFAVAMNTVESALHGANLFSYWNLSWFEKHVQPTLNAGDSLTIEHGGVLEGEKVWWHSSFAPLLDAFGDRSGTMVLTEPITQRRQRELAFERLSMVADHTNNSVVIADADGLVEYVNEGFTMLTGYEEYEMRGKKPGDVLQGPLTDPVVVRAISENLKAGEPVVEEILNYTKDGHPYWVSLVINPVKDSNGEVAKFVSIQADITATKMNSLDFRSKLTAFSRSNLIIEFDMMGKVIYANDLACDTFSYSEREFKGKPLNQIIPGMGKRKQTVTFLEEVAADVVPSNQVYEGVNMEEEEVWLRGTFSVIRDHIGEPIKYILFASDVTAERKLERENVRQQAELQSTFTAINRNLASCTFSLAGTVQEANDIFASILGYETSQLQGLSHLELLPAEERKKPQHKLMWENLKAGQFFTGDFTLQDSHGKTLWLSGTYSPINDGEGEVQKVVMIAQFTTHEKEKRKELEGALAALKNTLPLLEIKPNGTVKNASPLFMQVFDFRRKELFGQPLSNLLLGFSPTDWQPLLQELQAEGKTTRTWVLNHPNQKISDLKVGLHPIYSLEGELVKVISLWENYSPVTSKANTQRQNT